MWGWFFLRLENISLMSDIIVEIDGMVDVVKEKWFIIRWIRKNK